ncbi:MAG: OsmC family protein [Ktedonobacterales bacterium]
MAKEIEVHATLVGPMQWNVTSPTGHTVALDVPETDGGRNSGPTPMELLLMGLAGCTGMDVISMLRKQRQAVTGYDIRVRGVRADEHPRVYVNVEVEHVVTGHHIDPARLAHAIELSEHKYCAVGQTIAKTAAISTSYRIIEAEA